MTDRDRMTEMIKQANTLYLDYLESIDQKGLIDTEGRAEYIADYLIANGVIVMPCKFLQKCFVIPTIENNLSGITEMKCIGFSLSHDSYNANLITDKNKLYQPCFGAFGKTVFLTREEAEKVLERSKGNETNI